MFTLDVSPEFEDTVDMPMPGKAAEPVLFVFRHKSRDEIDAMATAIGKNELTLDDACRAVVVGWKYPGVEFTDAALTRCFQVLPGSAGAIYFGFRRAMTQGLRKNG